MANPNAPFGFRYIGHRDGVSPNFGNRWGFIAEANTNPTFSGDVLDPITSGFLDVATPTGGGAPVGGVAGWFVWNSKAFGFTIRQNWWPGNGDANGNVSAAYYADVGSIFEVQALLGPITQASVGLNGNFDVGAGGSQAVSGKSSYSLTAVGAGASLPFKIYGLPNVSGSGGNPIYVLPGYDTTTPYNVVQVTFNSLSA